MKQFIIFLAVIFTTLFFNNSILAADTKAIITSTSTTVCQNQSASVTFSLTNGEQNYNNPITYSYTLTGVSGVQQAISPNNSDTVTINVNTSVTGVYTYSHISATDSSNPYTIENIFIEFYINKNNILYSPTINNLKQKI